MAYYQKRKNGSWSVDWDEYPGGKGSKRVHRSQKPTPNTEKEARRLCAEIELSLSRYGSYQPARLIERQTLSAAFADYILLEVKMKFSPSTIRAKKTILQMYLDFVRGKADAVGCDALNRRNVALFYRWARETPGRNLKVRSKDTCAKYISIVQTAWTWLHYMETPGIDAPRLMKPPREAPKRFVSPTWRDVDKLIAEQRSIYGKRATTLLRFTGLRSNQICGLDWDDVNLERALIHLPGHLGKSRQEKRGRTFPISQHLVEEMATWGVRQGPVLPYKRIYAKNWREAWQRVIMKSNKLDADRIARAVEGQPIHCIRKTFVSELKKAGADDESVEFLVGHSRGIREHYLDTFALPLRETVELIPPIFARSVRTNQDNEKLIAQIGEGNRGLNGAPERNRAFDSE